MGRRKFFAHLDRLLEAATGPRRQNLEAVRATAQEYDEALESVLALRRRSASAESIARTFEDTVRPRKAALDQMMARLFESEEAELQSLDRSTARSASLVATASSGVALGALVVSLILAMKLGRAFDALGNKQRELESTMGQVKRANDDLEAFTGRIAHDLRTPLTPILLAVSGLKGSSDESVARAAQRIERSAVRATQMVEDFLAFSRVGRRVEDGSTFAATAIEGILEDVAEQIATDDIAVTLALDTSAQVACSETLFRQVMGNLIGNALKVMRGRDERRLQVRARVRESACEIEVEDSGPGIPSAVIGQVFDPFFRVPGTQAPGTGLGLAIVRRIVDAHGGSASVQSVPEKGATFRVVLPAAEVASEVNARAAAPADKPVWSPS